jgi:excisionase family DNA binding protein
MEPLNSPARTASRKRASEPIPRNLEELKALGPTVSIMQAAALLGMGRAKAYRMAREGTFPCKVIKVGRNYRVSTADLVRLLSAEAA